MRERDRASIRAHRLEIEAEERAKQHERERPIREAEEKLKKTSLEIARTIRERITAQRDDEFYIDPATAGISMTVEEADAFNRTESAKFARENPDYLPCTENLAAIVGYLTRNGGEPKIISAATLQAAFLRLQAYGLLKERPAPTPEPTVNLTIDRSKPTPAKTPQIFKGFDPLSGLERDYTSREIDRMSADEYKKRFPTLKTVAELLSSLKEQRAR